MKNANENQMDDEKCKIQLVGKLEERTANSFENEKIPEIGDIYDYIHGNVQSKLEFYEGKLVLKDEGPKLPKVTKQEIASNLDKELNNNLEEPEEDLAGNSLNKNLENVKKLMAEEESLKSLDEEGSLVEASDGHDGGGKADCGREFLSGHLQAVNGHLECSQESLESVQEFSKCKKSSDSVQDSSKSIEDPSKNAQDPSECIQDPSQYTESTSMYDRDSRSIQDLSTCVHDSSQCALDPSKFIQDSSRYPEESSKYSQDSSKYTQDSSKYPQDSSKYPQDSYKYPQNSSMYTQDPSKLIQDSSKFIQDSSKYTQDSSKYTQDPSKFIQGPSRCIQDPPKSTQNISNPNHSSKYSQDSFKSLNIECPNCQKISYTNDRTEILTELNTELKLEIENLNRDLKREKSTSNQLNFEIANMENTLEVYYKEAKNQKSGFNSVYFAVKNYVTQSDQKLTQNPESYTYKRIKTIAEYLDKLKLKLEHQDKIIKNDFIENPYYTDLIIKHEAVVKQLDEMSRENQELREEIKKKGTETLDIIKEINRQKFEIEHKSQEMEKNYRKQLEAKDNSARELQDECQNTIDQYKAQIDEQKTETAKVQEMYNAKINNYETEIKLLYKKWLEVKQKTDTKQNGIISDIN